MSPSSPALFEGHPPQGLPLRGVVMMSTASIVAYLGTKMRVVEG
jgi:hypothetical protein